MTLIHWDVSPNYDRLFLFLCLFLFSVRSGGVVSGVEGLRVNLLALLNIAELGAEESHDLRRIIRIESD